MRTAMRAKLIINKIISDRLKGLKMSQEIMKIKTDQGQEAPDHHSHRELVARVAVEKPVVDHLEYSTFKIMELKKYWASQLVKELRRRLHMKLL